MTFCQAGKMRGHRDANSPQRWSARPAAVQLRRLPSPRSGLRPGARRTFCHAASTATPQPSASVRPSAIHREDGRTDGLSRTGAPRHRHDGHHAHHEFQEEGQVIANPPEDCTDHRQALSLRTIPRNQKSYAPAQQEPCDECEYPPGPQRGVHLSLRRRVNVMMHHMYHTRRRPGLQLLRLSRPPLRRYPRL